MPVILFLIEDNIILEYPFLHSVVNHFFFQPNQIVQPNPLFSTKFCFLKENQVCAWPGPSWPRLSLGLGLGLVWALSGPGMGLGGKYIIFRTKSCICD